MISKIRNNLYIASFVDVTPENISKLDITTILNVAPEVPNIKLAYCTTIQIGFPDVVEQVANKDILAAKKLGELLSAGEKVLVHCKAGASRSPHVVTLYLAESEKRGYEEVYKEVRKLHDRTMIYSMRQEMVDKRLIKG